MAKFLKTKRSKKRGVLALSAVLAASLSLGMLSACATDDDGTNDNTDTSVSKTDTQLLKNGNFEFYPDNNQTEQNKKINLINTPDSWSRSTGSDANGSAPTSDAASGIINTAEWSYFAQPGRPFTSKEDALENWTAEGVTAFDRIKAYSDYSISSVDDFALYDDYKYTVSYNDIKGFWNAEQNRSAVDNPLTHDYAAGQTKDDNGVLMIHNEKVTNSSVYGTAQYYTSSTTVSLKAGTAAELSVWVKTSNLVHWENKTATQDCGAYIGVTNTVGGTTLDQMQIKNINTEQLNPEKTNNGWVKYSLYVRANTYAASTVRIVLGLGMGGTTDMYETVNGYAFFDDLTCKLISNDVYEEKTENISDEYQCDIRDYGEDKKFTATGDSQTYALDLYADFTDIYLGDPAQGTQIVDIDLTKETYGGREYTSETYAPLSLANDANNYAQVASPKEMKEVNNKYLQSVLEKDFANYPFDEEKPIVMLMSANGAPYTAKTNVNQPLAADSRVLVSFFVKTSEMKSFKGAGISIVDGENKTSISPFDSTTVATVDIDDDNKDIYDGWVQCFFFISNDTEENKTFKLEATYGSTSIVGTTKADYTDGYAAFANFQIYEMSETELTYVSTGDRAVTVSLTGKTSATSKFDDVAMNDADSVKTDIAKPANYLGVQGGDKRVGGTEIDSAFSPAPDGVYTGLVDSDYQNNYTDNAWKTELCAMAAQKGVLTEAVAADWWDQILGTAKQPLAIINKVEAAYGYLAHTTANLSSSSTRSVSVRVKVSQGAKAYVYLIDASDVHKGYGNGLALDLPELTYWYDDEGNLCTKDPADKDFDKKTDIAYFLGDNGLYTNATDKTDTKLYANLANYAKDDDGNLVTEEETVAYYAKDGKFYAYCDEDKGVYSTEVTDFDHKYARYDYTGKTMPEGVIIVDGTKDGVADKWVTVSFNVKTGNTAKDYRLEVWSGSRDGEVKNPAGSYVFFDDNSSSDLSSDYQNLLDEAVAALKKDENNVTEDDKLKDAIYYTYCFYDDVSYLRYDKTQDTDDKGNPYASYAQSSYSESIAYLYYEDTQSIDGEALYQMFLNYTTSDVTVEKDVTDDESTDEEEPEETDSGSSANLWLLASSGAMVVALVIVIASIAIRRALKNKKPRVRNAVAPAKKKQKAEKAPKEEKPEPVKKDENDPYNE